MIMGIGVDLIEIERVKSALLREGFKNKYFTASEIDMAQIDLIKLVDNFAVKEAVSKVLGTGFRGFSLIDIEVLRDELGKPYVNLYGKAKELKESLGITHIHVTISNTKDYTTAFAIGESVMDTTC